MPYFSRAVLALNIFCSNKSNCVIRLSILYLLSSLTVFTCTNSDSKLDRWNNIAIILYLCSTVGFFCSTSNGFDSSMFGNLLNDKTFLSFFAVGSVGIKAGIVSSMSQIGQVVAIPFVGPALDTW
jgi:hypothetical protein